MAPSSSTRDRFRLIATPAESRLRKFAQDVAAGLTAAPKRLSCCYFYDREGSRLFEDICELPEYYLTRAETEILTARAAEIAGLFPDGATLIELGSGNAAKTCLLIEAFLRDQTALRYVPIDICRTVLEESSRELLRRYPTLEILAVAGEYHDGLRQLAARAGQPKLILWLGSNVGNLHRPEAAEFLRRVRETMSPKDRLLVGIDLRKERAVLEKAYDDSQGVTAQFNKNVLARINRELGGNFELDRFDHRAVYDENVGRIEMYLVSTCAQHVGIERLSLEIAFALDETIHTENSYKYSPVEIDALATAAGLRAEQHWLDSQRRFSANLLAANEGR